MKTFQLQIKFHWNVFLRSNWQQTIIGSDTGRTGDSRLFESMMVYVSDAYMCYSASMS